MEKIQKKALFIVAPKRYQDYEYNTPKKILESAGIKVITASQRAGFCQGSFGDTAEAKLSLAEVIVDHYDAIVFVGGGGAIIYQTDIQAHLIAQEAVKKGKILAAICISPTTLAYAGVLEGKKATVWNEDGNQAQLLTKNGATFVDRDVVIDGKIVTANGPSAAKKFGEEILKLLA